MTAQKHPVLAQICAWLSDLVAGAAALSADPADGPWAVRPVFDWVGADPSMGRKGRSPDGTPYLVPVRRTGPVLVPYPYGEETFTQSVLAERSHRAWWSLITWLEPYVRDALRTAHAAVRHEIGGAEPCEPLLDDTTIAHLGDLMMFADGDEVSAVERMIDRCTREHTFDRVDPLRYMAVTLRRDAETAVRRHIDDPDIGRKVRALARELQTTDPQALLDAYGARWPADHVGLGRIQRSLDVAYDPMARRVGDEVLQ